MSVPGSLQVGDEDAAGRGRGHRAVQREVVAADALDGERRPGDPGSGTDRAKGGGAGEGAGGRLIEGRSAVSPCRIRHDCLRWSAW
jgi:hypothetical protein